VKRLSLAVCLLSALLCVAALTTDATGHPKRVLILYDDSMGRPGVQAADRGIRSILGNGSDIIIYSEHLDMSEFPDRRFQAAQLAWFRQKYRDQKIDLVLAGAAPTDFLPGMPVVFFAVEPTSANDTRLSSSVTGVWLSADYTGTLLAAQRLQPTARRVVVLTGSDDWDRTIEAGLRQRVAEMKTELQFDYWNDLSVDEITARLRILPKNTIVLYLSILRDVTGCSYLSPKLIPTLSAASAAPLYGLSDAFIGFGVVGGAVISFEDLGRQSALIGQRILNGEKPSDIPPATVSSSFQFDARQLQRFGLSKWLLPQGSIVKFGVPSAWDLYKSWIIGGAVFVFLQTAFIVYLLLQQRRRRRAEAELNYELGFESLLSGLSATVANVPTDCANTEIDAALKKLRVFLDLDRVSLYELGEGSDEFRLKSSAVAIGASVAPKQFDQVQFPWLTSNLKAGKDTLIRTAADLPPEAQGEKAFLAAQGYQFGAMVPLRAAGLTLGGLTFVSHRDMPLPVRVVQRLRVVAEIFANALIRKRIEEGLRESQQRFEIMANAAPVMIWMSGTDKLSTFFNQQWLSYTGRSLKQEIGDGWLNGVHPNDVDECMKTYISSFEARLPFTMEYRLRRSDGEFGWITDHGVPRYTLTGEFAGYIGSSTDVTERRQAEQGMLDLSGRLINAQEEERARIARELHDDFSQRLAVFAMQLGQVSMSLPESNKVASQRLHLMWERITELSSDIHKLSHRLHSSKLHHVGLLTAARSLCEETAKQYDLQIEFAASQIPDEISPDVALCFFRIIQEALNNIVKHSGAKRAYVQLSTVDSRIRLRIVDAGVGFDTSSKKAKGGLGLASMRERLRIMSGMLEIRSRPMEGTEIQAEAPMPRVVAEACA
jgi:PAS domain S-box-containing protein